MPCCKNGYMHIQEVLNIRKKKMPVILPLRDFSFDYNNNDDYRINNIVFYFSAAT